MEKELLIFSSMTNVFFKVINRGKKQFSIGKIKVSNSRHPIEKENDVLDFFSLSLNILKFVYEYSFFLEALSLTKRSNFRSFVMKLWKTF